MAEVYERVLVGVINRPKDFEIAKTLGWYRIPEGRAPKGIDAEYIAFFFSRRFKELNGGIHFYARRTGMELATRLQLLPDEPQHPHAQDSYHQIQFKTLEAKIPPILNTSRRPISFIHTTWDRFSSAQTISDLYSQADHLVDRVFYALSEAALNPQRIWAADTLAYPIASAQVRILCEKGEVIASTEPGQGILLADHPQQEIKQIKEAVATLGGPQLLPIFLD
jgi:hypothetical protein